jgi:drug/metabolite transporter (DMT)-like permease
MSGMAGTISIAVPLGSGKGNIDVGARTACPKIRYSRAMSQPARAGPRPSEQSLALAALLLGAVAVGASAIFVRVSELGALPSAFYRPFLAIPAIWLWLRLAPPAAPKRGPECPRDVARLLLAGGFFAGDLAFWHLSLHHTTVTNATLFANAAPVFVVVAERFLFGRHIGRSFLGGLALALAGAACLIGGSLTLEPANLLGDGFGAITAVFLAGYLIAVERLRHDFSAATIMLWTSIGTAVVLLPVAMLSGDAVVATTVYGWSILIALAWISHAAGQGLVAFALAHLPAGVAALGLLTEPVAAALLALIVLAEPITAWQIVGGTIILWGIFIARKGY